jgi:hypothetical protein
MYARNMIIIANEILINENINKMKMNTTINIIEIGYVV